MRVVAFLLGVVAPQVDYWVKLWLARGWWDASWPRVGDEAFAARFSDVWEKHAQELRPEIIATLTAQQKELKGFEVVKDWIVEHRVDRDGAAFTPLNGLMTPTFKMRRPQMLHRYVGQLKELYGRNGEVTGPDEHWPGE